MAEKIVLYCMGEVPEQPVRGACDILKRSQSHFKVELMPHSLLLPEPDLPFGSYSWNLLSKTLMEASWPEGTAYRFGILGERIEHNWFSRTVHDKRLCFITTKDWAYISDLPVEAFLAYEIVENLVEMLVGQMIWHDDTRGCLHDMCGIKTHISFKIRTADICVECVGDLQRSGVTSELLKVITSMLEEARLIALGRSPIPRLNVEPKPLSQIVDEEFPFPIAFCFRSMQSEIQPTRKFLKTFEVLEVSVKFLVALLLSDCSRNGHGREFARRLLGTPTLGIWLPLLKDLWDHVVEEPHNHASFAFVEESFDNFQQAYEGADALKRLRDDTRGHGLLQEDAWCQQTFNQNLPHLLTFLSWVQPLSRWRLMKIDALQHRRGIFTASAQLMRGSHPIFIPCQFDCQSAIDTECVIQPPDDNQCITLFPWVIYSQCPECFREMIFMYDKLERVRGQDVRVPWYREYPTNHTVSRQDLTTEYQR